MWNQLVYISCGLLLVGAASPKTNSIDIDAINEFLLEYERNLTLNSFTMCDHESGDTARCVKKSLCRLQAPLVDPATEFFYRESIEGGCTYLQICCPDSQINLVPPLPPPIQKPVGCGYSNPGAHVFREALSDYGYADFGDFPWMVALLKKTSSKAKFHDAYFGGGTLIDPSVVLTVAHKVDEMSASDLTCRAGEWDTRTEDETYPHQDRDAKKIVIHEQFRRGYIYFLMTMYKEAFTKITMPYNYDGSKEPPYRYKDVDFLTMQNDLLHMALEFFESLWVTVFEKNNAILMVWCYGHVILGKLIFSSKLMTQPIAYGRYDFALIILEKPFDLDGAPHIGVACLEKTLPPPGTECYSMGWGEDFITGKKKYADILKKLRLRLVDGKKCQNQYRRSKLGVTYNLHKSLTCAGGVPDVDTCIGDGGSSLVYPIPDKENIRYSVIGMVVYGLDCGTNLPGVYAKIPEVYDWLEKKMVLEGFTDMAFKKN